MTRNLITEEVAERHRDPNEPAGGYTFNAFPPSTYEGIAFVIVAMRLGDHAHLEWSSGRQVVQGNGRAHLHHSVAGRLVMAWPEWLTLRDIFDGDDRFRIAEVERPNRGQLDYHFLPGGRA